MKVEATSGSEEYMDTTHKKDLKRSIVLVAGDSISAGLNEEKLGKFGRKKVINISKGGSKIKNVQDSIIKFHENNKDTCTIEKVFLSVGTNDIRNAQHGIIHLKAPLIRLLKTTKLLFPVAKIYCQSLIPLPAWNKAIISNVWNMNNLIYNVCQTMHTYYVNIFHPLLDMFGRRNSFYFPESPHNIHPTAKGMSVIAKVYIYLIHNQWFNPLGY